MLKSFKTLAAIFILLISVTNIHADKIRIRLHQPPPNLMGVGNMWDLTLENTSSQDMKIYLVGTASEEKDGLIIEGKSKVFTIKPGRTSYKYSDFSNAEVKYNNGKYKEILLRTGNAPEGTYSICVTAYEESGEVAGQENCITQNVQQLGSLSLISPSDGEEIDPDTLPGLTFMWAPLPKGGPYSLKIVELKGQESPDVAIMNGRPILDINDIKNTTYSAGDPVHGVDVKLGLKYAWQVSSGDEKSEVWTFSVRSATHISSILDSVYCTGVAGQYRFRIRVCVDYNNTTFSSATIEPFTFTSNCLPSGVTYGITGLSPALPQTITTPGSGTNCITFTGTITTVPASVVTAIEMVATLRYGTAAYEVSYQPTGVFSALNNCCLPISQLPQMVGWWTLDETSGTTFFDRAGFNNQGTSVNSPAFISGKVAGGIDFTNGYISVQNHVDMNVYVCDSLSIDAWIKTSSNGTMAIVEKREMTSCGQPVGFSFFVQGGKLGFQTSNGVSFANYVAPGSPVNDGSWHLVAVTMNRTATNSTFKLYRDGVLIHTATSTGLVGSLHNGNPLLIGCIQPGMVFGGTTFSGIIDEVEMFKRVLTQPQIAAIFNAGSGGKCKQ